MGPVDNRRSLHTACTDRIWLNHARLRRLPRRPHSLLPLQGFNKMIETEVMVGSGLRITVSKDELVRRSASCRAPSRRARRCRSCPGSCSRRRAASCVSPRPTWSFRCARRVPAQIEGDGAIVLPGKTLVDIARLLPADEVAIEHKPAESVVHVTSGSASYTLHTYNPEDFPRLPELDARADVRGRSRVAARDDPPRCARGVA